MARCPDRVGNEHSGPSDDERRCPDLFLDGPNNVRLVPASRPMFSGTESAAKNQVASR